MRILHTSDWHVGRTIRGRSRAGEHREVLAEIAGVAAREQVDLVVVAGDLFDTAAPSPESEQIVYRTLLDLAATGAEVVALAGNHDNPRRLAAVTPLLDLARVHMGAALARPEDGGVVEVETASGETARVALLPFLSQRSIVRADDLMALDADQHAGQYAERCRQIVAALCASFDPGCVNVLVAHLTVAGGLVGGGERAAHTIFDYFVPPQAFPATAHYVALGHLHRPQRIPAASPTWYCGSPLHLDFGEAPGDKVVLVVDAAPGAPAEVREVALRSGRRLRTLRGPLDQIVARHGEVGDDFLRIVLEEAPRAGLADEVRERFPNAVDVGLAPRDGATPETEAWELDRLRGSPDELFAEYLREQEADDPEVLALFRDLLDAHLEAG